MERDLLSISYIGTWLIILLDASKPFPRGNALIRGHLSSCAKESVRNFELEL